MGLNVRVLIVEDDPLVLRLCRCVLERQGCTVLEATNAAEVSGAPVDIAVIDLVLPGVSGAQVARRLRAEGMTAPIVCVSGYPLSELPEADWPHVFSAYFLAKPFTPSQLVSMIEVALEEAGMR